MAIPEPDDGFGLWARVRQITGWPDTDETKMVDLLFAWRDGADTVKALRALDVNELTSGWPDDAGIAFRAKAAELFSRLEAAENQMRDLGTRAGQFALDVEQVKLGAHKLVHLFLQFYVLAGAWAAFGGSALQQSIVDKIAAAFTELMNSTAAKVATQPPVAYDDVLAKLAAPRSPTEAVGQFVQDHANTVAALADVTGDISTALSVAGDVVTAATDGAALPAKLVLEGISTTLGWLALTGHVTAKITGANVAPETIGLDMLGVSQLSSVIPVAAHTVLEGTELFGGASKSTIFDDIGKYWAPNANAHPGVDPLLGSYNPALNAANEGRILDHARQTELLEQRARSRGTG